MYGCAVWGYGAINEIEAYHLQFMKRTLGVNPREPWATPVLHDIKLVIKWISFKLA